MINPQAFDLHLFDLDDTLINTRHSYALAQEKAVREIYSDVPAEQITKIVPDLKWICKRFGSGNVREYMDAFVKSHPEYFDYSEERLAALVAEYHRLFFKEMRCFKGARAYIQYLISNKKAVGLVSNGIVESQQEKLNLAGLSDLFPDDLCFISESFPNSMKKPSPHMIELACQKSGISPKKTVFYGNSIDDLIAGNLAGVITVYYSESTPITEELRSIAIPNFEVSRWEDLF